MKSGNRFPHTAMRARTGVRVLALAALLLLAACGAPMSSGAPTAPATPAPPATGYPEPRRVPPQDRSFERISAGEGLSHSTVNAILQDSRGFMWFGTNDGLNRYDGYEFTVYRHDPQDAGSLSHNRVWSLFEDAAGDLWAGTYGGGLNRYDRDTDRFVRYDADDFGNVTDEPEEFRNVVWAIGEDPPGTLWIATYGGGLVRFDLDTETFSSYAPDPDDPDLWGHEWIMAMLVDRQGQIWLGTDSKGLDRFDPASGTFTSYHHDPDEPQSLGHDQIRAIVQDSAGRIWIGTSGGGLDRYEPESDTFAHYRHDPDDPFSLSYDYIGAIVEDPAGVLWLGTPGRGLDAFAPDAAAAAAALHFRHDPADPRSLGSDRVHALYLDPTGSLWVGTSGSGLSRSDPASARYAYYRGDPGDLVPAADYQVLSLHEDEDGLLWIGTSGSGLDVLDRETGEWRHHRHDPDDPARAGSNVVFAIHEGPSGSLWLGTAGGVYRVERATGRFERLPHKPPDPGGVQVEAIYAILQDSRGVVWLGTHGRGLSEYHPATGQFHYHTSAPGGLNSNWVRAIVEDPAGALWIATDEGLNRYDPRTGQWVGWTADPDDANSLSHDWIHTLHLDGAGGLWIGTLGGGLNHLDIKSGAISRYRQQDGLANDMALSMAEKAPPYGGFLWIGTANGLTRLDMQSGAMKTIDAGDGLPVTEFRAALQGKNGELFFGGSKGLIAFDPARMADNPYVPPVVLTSVQQNGVDVETGQAPENLSELTLRWPENSFEFDFAALSYTHPEKNQHAYLLEGFDEAWNEIGSRRHGRYTNLPGGTYTLRLRGSNNDGVWNQNGAAIKVTVVPAFWQTPWFWGLVILALTGGAFAGYRLRLHSLQVRSRALEEEVKARTLELQLESDQRIEAEQALHRQEQQQLVTEERNRLARELHDSVTQALYGVTLYSEAASGQLALGNTQRATEHLHELQDTAHEALAEMRLLVFELRPPILEEEGLVGALQARLQAVEGRAGLKTTFSSNLEGRLPPDVEQGLYRIAQEALNNALKHAQARHIRLRLQHEGGAVTLTVADDGGGFQMEAGRFQTEAGRFQPEAAPTHGGLGLQAMAERAAEMGATFAIDTAPGAGTRVTVMWEGGKVQE